MTCVLILNVSENVARFARNVLRPLLTLMAFENQLLTFDYVPVCDPWRNMSFLFLQSCLKLFLVTLSISSFLIENPFLQVEVFMHQSLHSMHRITLHYGHIHCKESKYIFDNWERSEQLRISILKITYGQSSPGSDSFIFMFNSVFDNVINMFNP